MSREKTDMHRLQELVRLHRMGAGKREVVRLLGMSPNTERQYRHALNAMGLLAGGIEDLPDPAALKTAVHEVLPPKQPAEQVSTAERGRRRSTTAFGSRRKSSRRAFRRSSGW